MKLDAGQSVAKSNGDAVPFEGFHVRGKASHGGGLVKDLPTKVLHLSRADDGAAVAHVSSPRDEKDAGAEVSVSDAAAMARHRSLTV